MKALLNGAVLGAWILVTAIVTTAPVYLAVTSHEHKAPAGIEQIPSTLLVEQSAASSATSARLSASPSDVHSPPSPFLSDARFRFGFLEFEEDIDAPIE